MNKKKIVVRRPSIFTRIIAHASASKRFVLSVFFFIAINYKIANKKLNDQIKLKREKKTEYHITSA